MQIASTSATTIITDPVWWSQDRIPDACIYRWTWMRLMGMKDDEIDRHMAENPPTSADEEMEQLRAMHAIYLANPNRRDNPFTDQRE